jgi:hypothetical protein
MKFRLLYEGPIPPRQRVRVGDIHSIRVTLHPQIKELWRFLPLSDNPEWLHEVSPVSILERVNGVLFAPLISRKINLACELDITFLRQQPPGTLLGEGGDIDNRLKTLLDGLREPSKNEAQQSKIEAGAADEPFHCLLQDDALVTRLNVETDRLLRPAADKFDMVAIIQVTVVITRMTVGNISLVSQAQ